MKKLCEIFVILVLLFLSAAQGHSETTSFKTTKVQFSDPSKPGILKIVNGEGDVTITGYEGKDVMVYEGKDVMVDVESQGKIVEPPEENEKAKGMKRITGTRFNITQVKEENAIVISRSMKDETDLVISVPRNTSLRIGGRASGINGQSTTGDAGSIMNAVLGSVATAFNFAGGQFQGDITVENVQGNIEISTLDGAITVRGASGSVVASAMDGDVTVTFASVKSDNPMAFSTMDGDIDVTFPAGIKATLTARNVEGDIFTDFDMEMIPVVQVTKVSNTGSLPATSSLSKEKEEKPSSSVPSVPSPSVPPVGKEEGTSSGSFPTPPSSPAGIFVGMFGNTVTGKINGGGMEIQMTTIDGSIYIRKGK